MNTQKFILAGFGGQGVLLIGQMIAYAAMYEEKHVTFMPSYGPEMRGGTANCTVIVSDEPIACPLVDTIDHLVTMNLPSLLKFESMLRPEGTLFLNTSMIKMTPSRKDLRLCRVDAGGLAQSIGNARAANIVMLGAIAEQTKVVELATLERVMKTKVFTGAKAKLLPLNEKALTVWRESSL